VKAKNLIRLIQTVDENAEIATPGFDEYGAAIDFSLVKIHLIFNVREPTTHFAPHDYDDYPENEDMKNGYLLDGKW